ncbi:hypothetical protein STRINF_00759 [Streptococcus infantarius subsp. infantarius ATCC BAA-102]|uniref:Uncharacterized protein n=1 Tax=Streptococcus infantarius subsp. infantarius ATCC BAA-102 TaxID=471872 RepID=A0ABM9XF44_9STRE|nr:hypothetical protein STRINF_00759 [Streptococcus infantarius subsp. infantarius ATCC BAA-102]
MNVSYFVIRYSRKGGSLPPTTVDKEPNFEDVELKMFRGIVANIG